MAPRSATPGPTAQQLITDVVRLLIRVRGDTHGQIATALGIVRPAVSARLSGVTRWTVDDLDGLAAYFGVSPATFLVPAQLLLGGGGVGGDQGDRPQLVAPLDLGKLVAGLPEPPAHRRRKRGAYPGPQLPRQMTGSQLDLAVGT